MKLVEITCPYCGGKFQIDIDQLIGTYKETEKSGLNIEIKKIHDKNKYYVRKRDGRRLPYLPYPLSKDNIAEELEEYNRIADECIEEIVEVTGNINGRIFKVDIWHFKNCGDEYSQIAYVIKGSFKGGPLRVKDVKYSPEHIDKLRITAQGLSKIKTTRHRLKEPEEIEEVMKYIGDFVHMENGDFIMDCKPGSTHDENFLKKLILIWYTFYAKFNLY